MSLGMLWSLLNPLVMMGVLTFVYTRIFSATIPHFPAFVLCGMIPYNFFAGAWISGTTSIVDNAGLVKRVPVPREMVPITSVLSNCLHLVVQIALLLFIVAVSGYRINPYWAWLPVIWGLEVVFVCGLALITSAVNVYIRDTRYVVESATTVLFWLVPVIYDFSIIPKQYREVYQLNPIAAVVFSIRKILLEGQPPVTSTLVNIVVVSFGVLALGLFVFGRMKPRFYEHI